MGLWGQMFSTGSKYLGRAATIGKYIAQKAPTALSYAHRGLTTAQTIASNPLAQQAMSRMGIAPNKVMAGVNNAQAGLNMLPNVARSVGSAANQIGGAARQGVAAGQQARASLAELYRTAHG